MLFDFTHLKWTDINYGRVLLGFSMHFAINATGRKDLAKSVEHDIIVMDSIFTHYLISKYKIPNVCSVNRNGPTFDS